MRELALDKRPRPEEPEQGEALRVIGHRTEILMALGYEYAAARRLAESRADWHEVQALLRRGATHEQAARIAS